MRAYASILISRNAKDLVTQQLRSEMRLVSLRALAPSLTRITVAGAIGAAMHIGQRNCDFADAHAIEFSRGVLAQTDVEGEVICCEGPKDNAPSFAYDAKRIERLKHAGVDVDKTYNQDELARGSELVFAASGITKGELLDGVR
jgi:fructose-1,6-bisphosphatase II